ncbi:MAG: protein kinase [Anaerolineae bacterium]|nr:protein kinase [Anaerolineae bacterium]
MVGQQISHYQIKALLGQGRIGNVYQAVDLEDFSLVAIKVIHLHLTEEPGIRRRFLQEVNAIPKLDHPSIVKVHEAGIDTNENILYMTMDYLTGRSLTSYLRQLQFNNQQLDLGDALVIVAQIAEALDYAHQKGLLHRDIRPTVILFRTDDKPKESHNLPGRAVISDFALETMIAVEKEPFAPALPYMSPEAFLDRPLDRRSDIYSLGILLYQLTTGRLPFTAATLAEAARQHPYQDPPPPRELRPEMPLAMEGAILKAMAKKPEARYQTGANMAAALRNLAETLPERMSETAVEADIFDIKTTPTPPLVVASSHWAEDEDNVMVTRDMPQSLRRQIITIGRSETNDIVLEDTGVTRQHAQLERTASGWQVRDLGSLNGTFLDEKPLLPDIPEEWQSHQTLRVGPFFLHLQPGKGMNAQKRPFQAIITPNDVSVLPGERTEIGITILNQGTAVDEFSLSMDRIPAQWVTLPTEPLRLRPDERKTVTAYFHPPLVQDVLLGTSRYLLTINSANQPQERLAIPGVVQVLPPKNIFTTALEPSLITHAGQGFLTISNRALTEQLFTINGTSEEGDVRFSIWRLKEAAAPAPTSPSKNGSGKRPSSANMGTLNKLPLTRRLVSAPRRAMMQLENSPRQALNRMMPGLGHLLPRTNLSQQASKAASGKMKPAQADKPSTPNSDPATFEEVVFPGNLYTQIIVPPGGEELVRLGLKPEKRPLFGQKKQLLPYTLRISAPGSEGQTVGGQVEMRPRIRINPVILIIFFLLLFLCAGSFLIASLTQESTLAAILNTPADIDNDGLSNLAEVYVHETDPNLADTDGDTLSDGDEIAQGTNPRLADTDQDGLTDDQERRLNTNPLFSDTDGDNLSDGLEAQRLSTDPLLSNTLTMTVASLATPTLIPTAAPTAIPTPLPTLSPSAFSDTFRSLAAEDGYIMEDKTLGRAPIADDVNLQLGEGNNNERQIKTFLSFDTSTLPDDAVILSARIQLRRNNVVGQPENLGVIYFDMAPNNGFNNNWALESEDFSAPASSSNVATIQNLYSGDWLEAGLAETYFEEINRNGRSQFRLYFTLTNNSDDVEDRISFYAGDEADSSFQPQLIIDYELP